MHKRYNKTLQVCHIVSLSIHPPIAYHMQDHTCTTTINTPPLCVYTDVCTPPGEYPYRKVKLITQAAHQHRTNNYWSVPLIAIITWYHISTSAKMVCRKGTYNRVAVVRIFNSACIIYADIYFFFFHMLYIL
jgi:hypothetical protein